VAASFGLALSLAAPFLIASLLYNVALGVINKAMPQLMVAFVGAPAITWGGLFLLLITTPFLLPVWFASFQAALVTPLGAP
jgi:flagellar biosynthetic protein FliR